jgi:TRAP-type C4-dicarboxylate transport system permease small subunit
MLALYMAYACISFVHDSYRFADVSTGMLAIPLWIPQSSMALGTVLLAVALIEETIRVIRGNQPIYETKETQSFTSE